VVGGKQPAARAMRMIMMGVIVAVIQSSSAHL
jgi:hypothetical protein